MRMLDLLALIATGLVATSVHAQATTAYPTRPVRVIVAFTAGGTTDVVARAVTQKLAESLKQPFIIENKPGAGGNLGTEYVVRSPPDGYTLIVNTVGPMAVNKTLYRNLAYDPLVDLVPIVRVCDVPNVLVVHPDVPAQTFEEFVAYAKANPRKLNYASTGVGTSAHLSSFTLSKRIGAEAQHVPYKGADGLTDLVAGRTQFTFATIPSVIGFIKAGKLRALAVNSLQRSRSLPDVPTVAEKGFADFPSGSWVGFFAPRTTPAVVVTVINQAVNEALPSLEAQLVAEGADPVGGTPADFAQFTQQQFEKWRTIVRESGATVD
jgi:tripartite-type tricarboxylate transporter receptor subunit TctC